MAEELDPRIKFHISFCLVEIGKQPVLKHKGMKKQESSSNWRTLDLREHFIRSRDPQPSTGQNSWNPVVEREEG